MSIMGPVWAPNFLLDTIHMRLQDPSKTLSMLRNEGPIVLMMLAQTNIPKTWIVQKTLSPKLLNNNYTRSSVFGLPVSELPTMPLRSQVMSFAWVFGLQRCPDLYQCSLDHTLITVSFITLCYTGYTILYHIYLYGLQRVFSYTIL